MYSKSEFIKTQFVKFKTICDELLSTDSKIKQFRYKNQLVYSLLNVSIYIKENPEKTPKTVSFFQSAAPNNVANSSDQFRMEF